MYKKLFFVFILLSISVTNAQVGINTTNIDNGVMLEVDSDDSGILIPRISLSSITDNTTIPAPITNGTLIYNLTNNTTLQEGFYYWQNTQWALINAGAIDNVYTTDGTLNTNRTINTGTNTFRLSGEAEYNALTLQRTDNTLERGLSFQNSGNYYDASIFMESTTRSGLVFATGSNVADPSALGRTLTLEDNQGITFDQYGNGTFTGTPAQILAVGTNGGVIELESNRVFELANSDWFEANTTSPPNSIDDNIYTNGNVGIQTNNPDASASLELGATDQGLLVNRVALTDASLAAPITNPADGLLVFNTNENLVPVGYEDDVRKGFYYWDASQSRWIPQQSENRSARYVNTNTNFDLNQSIAVKLPIFESEEWNDDVSLYTTPSSPFITIQVNEDGRYEISVNLSITSTVTRTNIAAEILVNTATFPGATSATGYMRNANNHDISSIHIREVVELTAGDLVAINVSQEANAGVVNMAANGSCNFTITKIK